MVFPADADLLPAVLLLAVFFVAVFFVAAFFFAAFLVAGFFLLVAFLLTVSDVVPVVSAALLLPDGFGVLAVSSFWLAAAVGVLPITASANCLR